MPVSTLRNPQSAARCLTEGVDVPGIDCVLFADPKRSTVDIVQAVGRALRKAEGKKLGYVIVPILLDSEVQDDKELEDSAFETILTVLRALASNDERIAEYFRSRTTGKKRKRGRGVIEDFEVPDGVTINTEAFQDAVELKVWSRLAKLSWRPLKSRRAKSSCRTELSRVKRSDLLDEHPCPSTP